MRYWHADQAVAVLTELLGPNSIAVEPAVAKLSVMGVGIRSHTGVATRMFAALAAANINIAMINTSEVRISVVVDRAKGKKALDVLRGAFNL